MPGVWTLAQNTQQVDERERIELQGRQMGVRFVDLEKLAVDPDIARLVPEHLARRYQVFPVDLKDNQLTLAMHDPLNVIALDDIRLATGFDLFPVIAIKRELQKLLDDQFGERPGSCESPGEMAKQCELDDCLYQVAMSDRGQLVLRSCPEAASSPSVRFLAKPDDFRHWVDFKSDSYTWLLAPTGQRIVLDTRGELLGSLPDDLEQRLLAVEKDWTLATLERTPTGVCLHPHEETALILNASHGWRADVPWLQARLENRRYAPGSAHLFPIPGDCSAIGKGAALLKLMHYAHGGPPSDVAAYYLRVGTKKLRLPSTAGNPDCLSQGMTPRAVLRKMGCPDWIDLRRRTIWDYYCPQPQEGCVARTTVEWGPEGKMRALTRVQMGRKQIAERANLIVFSGALYGPRNPPEIVEIRP